MLVDSTLCVFTDFKEFENATLVRPPQNFLNSMEEVEKKFIDLFPNLYFEKNFEYKIINELKNDFSYICCCCNNDSDYLLRLYIRIRIYLLIKNFNKNVKKTCNKQKLINVTNM